MSLAMSKETSVSGEAYNLRIRRFPGNIFAGMFGYDAVQYFQADASASKTQADASASKTPDVNKLIGN